MPDGQTEGVIEVAVGPYDVETEREPLNCVGTDAGIDTKGKDVRRLGSIELPLVG